MSESAKAFLRGFVAGRKSLGEVCYPEEVIRPRLDSYQKSYDDYIKQPETWEAAGWFASRLVAFGR